MREFNLYNGKVKVCSSINGNEAESRVELKPGSYDLGKANYDSTITIIDGEVIINGTELKKDQKIEIKTGQKILVGTKIDSVYLMKTDNYRN